MNYKQFKNNNFNVKADKLTSYKDLDLVIELLTDPSLDFEHVGQENLGNNMAAHVLVNHNTNRAYLVTEQDIIDYKDGSTVKLIAIPFHDDEV